MEQKYSPEFKDECVQEVIRSSRTIAQVARENGVVQQTLRNWVNAYKKQHPAAEPELSVSERARLKQLKACRLYFAGTAARKHPWKGRASRSFHGRIRRSPADFTTISSSRSRWITEADETRRARTEPVFTRVKTTMSGSK